MKIKTQQKIVVIFFMLIMTFTVLSPAFAWDDCKNGSINCSSPCSNYKDTDGNNICDRSEKDPEQRESSDTEAPQINTKSKSSSDPQGYNHNERTKKTYSQKLIKGLTNPRFIVSLMLLISALIVVRRRLRGYARLIVLLLGLLSLGFYFKGCPCPVGVLANIPLRLKGLLQGQHMLWLLLFLLPIVFIFWGGRIYCGGVCPFGAVQEFTFKLGSKLGLNQARPGLEKFPWLRYIKYFVLLGTLIITPLIGTVWWCSIDPFGYLFKFSGTTTALILLIVLLSSSLFVSRPWCRIICPYGALLGILSKGAGLLPLKRNISPSIDKSVCKQCKLCARNCPVDAIHDETVNKAECINCGECCNKCKCGAIK